MGDHGHGHHHGDHHLDFDSPEMADFAELEGEVMLGLVTQAVSVVAELSGRHGVEVRRVLDIGCGPGVATCCLAQQFPSATVLAADGSSAMLQHVTTRAARLGLSERVQTRLVDLPAGLGTLDRSDVVWASMVVHHVGDEAALLQRLRENVQPGGLLAIVEFGDPLRVVLDDADLGRPGLWDRIEAAWSAWFTEMRAELPDAKPSADYPTALGDAGFDLLTDEMLRLELDAPLNERARRYAHDHVMRMRDRLEPYAPGADLEALGGLVGDSEHSLLHRNDVRLRASRHVYVARAPGAD